MNSAEISWAEGVRSRGELCAPFRRSRAGKNRGTRVRLIARRRHGTFYSWAFWKAPARKNLVRSDARRHSWGFGTSRRSASVSFHKLIPGECHGSLGSLGSPVSHRTSSSTRLSFACRKFIFPEFISPDSAHHSFRRRRRRRRRLCTFHWLRRMTGRRWRRWRRRRKRRSGPRDTKPRFVR
jgi:hypothetical protein